MENENSLNTDQYIQWIINTIEKYKKYSDELLRGDERIEPYQIQTLMAQHQSIKLGLLAEKHRLFREFRKEKRNFRVWWNTCLVEAKAELTKPNGKFPAVKDYTIQAQEKYKDIYSDKEDRLQDLEDKYEFFKELKDDWASFTYMLQGLNDNMKSELRSLLIDYIPKEDKPKERKTRQPKEN